MGTHSTDNITAGQAPAHLNTDAPVGQPPHRIHTPRLYLRPVSDSDRDDFVALLSDAAVMRFVGLNAGEIPQPEEIVNLLASAVEAWSVRGYGRWSMFCRKTSEFVGFCGFRAENEEPELICALHRRYWNQGLSTEASAACLDYAFENFCFSTVRAFTHPHNKPAQRVLGKLGACFDGCVVYHGVTAAAYHFRRPS